MTSLAVVSAFGAGAISGVGPCLAPRVAVLVGLMGNRRGSERALDLTAFIAGLCAGYLVLASIAGAVQQVARYSSLTYGLLAMVLIAGGLRAMLRNGSSCRHDPHRAPASRSATLLAGAAFSGIGTPCCGPLVATMVVAGQGVGMTAALAAFFVGHATVLAAVALPLRAVRESLTTRVPSDAITTVGAGVTLAMGAYYAMLV